MSFCGKSDTLKEHVVILNVLRLDVGLQVNLNKSTEGEFLGFCWGQQGFKLTKKHIEALPKLAPPSNVKKTRMISGNKKFHQESIPH